MPPGVLLLVALWASPSLALHKEAPQAMRLTSGASHGVSTGRSWGSYVAFTSATDLLGDGTTGQQIYVFSLLDYACQQGRPDLRPPTEGGAACPAPARPWLRRVTKAAPGAEVSNPTVDATGTIVAFEAWGRFGAGITGPAANRRQIFLKHLATGALTPVTANPDGDSTRPTLNENGGTLAFQSTASLLGTPSGTSQIYVYRVGPAQLVAVTDGAGPSRNAMLNKLGTHVAFESEAALRGDGRDTGVAQIFLYDIGEETLLQLTAGNADSRWPWVEEKRPGSVFFESAATDLPGTAGGPGTQIYQAQTNESELPTITQFTFGPGNARWPSVAPSGGRLLFVADGDLLQNGTTGRRLFGLDFRDTAAVLYQITGRGNVQGAVSAALGTWFALLASDDDVSGEGVCGQQLFIVDYDPSHWVVAGRQRLAATQLGQLPAEPFPGSRDAGCADGDACTADTCSGANVCTHALMADGTACGDGDQCSGVPVCQAGTCTAQGGLGCDDANVCTDDACDAEAGCTHVAIDCRDDDPCTEDTCDPATGCAHAVLPGFDAVDCQQTQVRAATPSSVDRRLARRLDRATGLAASAGHVAPRRARKRLQRAARLLEQVAADVAIAEDVPRPQRVALVDALQALIDRITYVIADLDAASGGRRS